MNRYPGEHYIGDGVYASFDGWQFLLRTVRDGRDERIYLDPATFDALMQYRARILNPVREEARE